MPGFNQTNYRIVKWKIQVRFPFKKKQWTTPNPSHSAANELHPNRVLNTRIRREQECRLPSQLVIRDHCSLPRCRGTSRSRRAQRMARPRPNQAKNSQRTRLPTARSKTPQEHQIARRKIDTDDGPGRFRHARYPTGRDHLR
jgi:hypothetical protein